MKNFIKSPLNYTGGKYKLLEQIVPHFPTNIGCFVDLFCGGCNVGINVVANKVILNDSCSQLQELYSYWKKNGYSQVKTEIVEKIDKYQLSKTNEDGFKRLRESYNATHSPIELFLLIAYSFNHQIRFNKKNEFNMPFGRNKSEFNPKMDKNLLSFINELVSDKFVITNQDFTELKVEKLKENDLVYCDPPYLITTASYNENGGWNEEKEFQLLDLLDRCNSKNIKFALSNVLCHKDKSNDILIDWSEKYNVIHLNKNYSNCNYHILDREKNFTDEVLILNF